MLRPKYYQIVMRLINDERIEVHVEAENILNLVEELSGNRLTFISKDSPDRDSFSIYAHQIKRMDYAVKQLVMPIDKGLLYVVRSAY